MFLNRQILIEFLLLIIFFPSSIFAFTDESHFSTIFNEVRFFRVFTPPGYNPASRNKRYPVIYYFHGCGGSYRKSGAYSYNDYGLTAPVAIGKNYEPDYDFPNNADFEVWGYYVTSDKKGEGWIYLRNVTKNGTGIYTRKQLPWGKSLPCFDISVTTPPLYAPDGIYTITRYSYSDNKFSTSQVRADAFGKIKLKLRWTQNSLTG